MTVEIPDWVKKILKKEKAEEIGEICLSSPVIIDFKTMTQR